MKHLFKRLVLKRLKYLALVLSSGLLSLAAAPGDLIPGWPVSTQGILFGSPAIGPHGEIVIGSEDAKVYSFNPDGTLRWVFTEGSDWFDSSPAIGSDGTVYIGCWDDYLYAIDGDSGALKWKYQTGSLIAATPTLGPDGTIYFGSYDGVFYALWSNGTLRWIYEAGDELSPINGGAALNASADTLYFGTETGDLYALNAVTGAKRWSFTVPAEWVYEVPEGFTERPIPSAPAIAEDGTIYFCCENGYLYALSSYGAFLGKFDATDSIKASPIVDSFGRVYFASQDGYLYAVGTDPQVNFLVQIWEAYVGDVFYCTAAMDEERNILIAGYAGSSTTGVATEFTQVNASGVIQWEYRIAGLNDSSPNIGPDGCIYIGAHDGLLYKLEGNAPLNTSGWPRFQGNRRNTGWIPDLYASELVDYFPALSVSKDGWVLVPWFGIGWLTDADLPWIQHLDHGHIYLAGASTWGVYFFDSQLAEWFYAPAYAANYYFRYKTSTWVYHFEGTNITTGRWFYDYNQTQWIPESLL